MGSTHPPGVIKTTNSNTATGNGIISPKLLGNFLRLRDREGSCRVRHQSSGATQFLRYQGQWWQSGSYLARPWPSQMPHYKKVPVLLVSWIIKPGLLYTLHPSYIHPARVVLMLINDKLKTDPDTSWERPFYLRVWTDSISNTLWFIGGP